MSIQFSPFEAVIFDMDGTILDTESVFRDIVYEVCEDLGFPMLEHVHLAMIGSSHETSNRILVEAFGSSFPYTLFDQRCGAGMAARMDLAVPLKAGVTEMLDELEARGIPTAIATSSRKAHAARHLSRAGVSERFRTVVTRDDVAYPKPHPEPYITAARRLAVEPARCLAFEDSHSGVRAAHAAGMQTVMVPDLVRPTDEIARLCVAVMDSLSHARDAVWPRG